MKQFKIFDWAGNELNHGSFQSFDDAWEYILGDMTEKLNLTEDDLGELYVEETN